MINCAGEKMMKNSAAYCPSAPAKAAYLSKYRLLIDFKLKPITQAEIEPLRIILFDKHARLRIVTPHCPAVIRLSGGTSLPKHLPSTQAASHPAPLV